MTRMKMPDDTMGRVGAIMHNARMSCRMSRDELADMLRILPNELAAYEHGKIKIPAGIIFLRVKFSLAVYFFPCSIEL